MPELQLGESVVQERGHTGLGSCATSKECFDSDLHRAYGTLLEQKRWLRGCHPSLGIQSSSPSHLVITALICTRESSGAQLAMLKGKAPSQVSPFSMDQMTFQVHQV